MDFFPIFMKMVELFLIIVIGYVATKLNVMNPVIKTSLTKVILNIALPCTILASVMTTTNMPNNKEIFLSLGISFLSYGVFFVLSKIIPPLLRLKGRARAAAEFGIIFANVGFIGYPVTQAIFGMDCTFITCLFNMPFNLICYSYGVYILEKANISSTSDSKNSSSSFSSKELAKLIINPALVASIICITMALLKISGPKFIGETLSTVGSITTPGALLIIGSALAQMKFTEMFNNIPSYLVSISCVVLTPLVIYGILFSFLQNYPLILGEAVIISAMPVATSGTMLCVEHGGDETFMAQITFLSTLLSIITIPLIATIL